MAVQPGQGKPRVIIAVYGGLKDGKIQGKIVTDALQTAINKAAGEKVKIDNPTMGGDPFSLVKKQLGALVEGKGKMRAFVCEENQTIAFTIS
jgi:hypothetical protein